MTTARPPSGHYPIANTDLSELERLRIQDEAWQDDTLFLLDQIGVHRGWKCLDLGCGPFGLTRHLSERVGDTGQVTGLEYNEDFIRLAREGAPENVNIIQGDAYRSGLPNDSFDLVHMRFLGSVAGDTQQLVAEAVRMTRPGGFVAIQEADVNTLKCYPNHPAWDKLLATLIVIMPEVSGSNPVAHAFYPMLLQAGVSDLNYRPCVVGVKAGDPWRDFLPSTALSARSSIEDRGLMSAAELDQAVIDCRDHLINPEVVFIAPMLVQVWGRKASN